MSRNTEVQEQEAVTEAERLQHEKYLQNSDRCAVEQLKSRYGDVVPAERIDKLEEVPTTFENREQFDRSFEQASGRPAGEGERIVGYSQGIERPAHVAMDHLDVEGTVMHERLHQMSSPEASRILGDRLNEGVTEDLARENLGAETPNESETAYRFERSVSQQLRETCGEDSIEDAYFKGDETRLKECLDERFGSNALDRFRETVDTWDELDENGNQ